MQCAHDLWYGCSRKEYHLHQGLVVPRKRAIVDDAVLHHSVGKFPLVLWRDDSFVVTTVVLEQGGVSGLE